MSAAFDRAAIRKPFRILGKDLLPFSVGHEILLNAGGNGFAQMATREPGFSDLALAVRICSQDYDSAIDDVVTGTRKYKLWLWLLGFKPFILNTELLKFHQYLEHYRSGPEFTRKTDISRSATGAPFEYTLKVFLCTRMGLTVSEALNYPYCTAVADYLTFLESRGALHIVDSVEELAKEAKAMQAEIIEKAKQWQ